MGQDGSSNDQPQFEESIQEMHEKAMLENELMGIKLKHMLILGGIILLFVVILITLWNYCASERDEAVEYTCTRPNDVKTVVAREIRPGLILVQGYPSQEETLRIVAEYDAMQTGARKVPNYGAAADYFNPTAMTSNFYQQPTESIIFPVAPSAPNGSTERLIDIGHGRPPPYSLDQQRHLR